MSPIRLSIIVPAYNREATIGSALQSIGRTLPDNCEVIVVDDGSTDQTALQAARALRAMDAEQGRIIRQQGAGPGELILPANFRNLSRQNRMRLHCSMASLRQRDRGWIHGSHPAMWSSRNRSLKRRLGSTKHCLAAKTQTCFCGLHKTQGLP